MKNEEIVVKLRDALRDGSFNMITEPLVASKHEHKFMVIKDVPDSNDTIGVIITLQFETRFPQARIEPMPKTTMRSTDGGKEITINITPAITSIVDDASLEEIKEHIYNLAYNLSDIMSSPNIIDSIADIESSIALTSKGLYRYNIILPEAKMGIVYELDDVIEGDERSKYVVLSRFDKQVIHVDSAETLDGALTIIKDSYPKELTDCWWRIDATDILIKLFGIKEPKVVDNTLYKECIGEFRLPSNPKLDYNCWLKVTKSSVNEQSKLYIESSTLSPYISIKASLNGYDDIVSRGYIIVNKINALIDILENMRIGLNGDTLYQLLSKTSGHIDILYRFDNDLLITYWSKGLHDSIWITMDKYSKPRVLIGSKREPEYECTSVEEALNKIITDRYSTK
jgi:hypothetical protein